MTSRSAVHKALTTRTVLLAAFALLGLGIAGLTLSELLSAQQHPVVTALLRELGALLTVSACLTTAWDLIAKRAFKDELLATVDLSSDINRSGIVQVPTSFTEDIPWRELLVGAKKVDLFFAYARTWRGMNVEYLRRLAADPEAQIRVILPDRNDDTVAKALAMNFQDTSETLEQAVQRARQEIQGAETDLKDIFCNAAEARATFQLFYYQKVPFFSAYRFDGRTIIAFYKHRKGRGGVPSFVAKKGGFVNEFVYSELEYLLDPESADSRLIVECPSGGSGNG